MLLLSSAVFFQNELILSGTLSESYGLDLGPNCAKFISI